MTQVRVHTLASAPEASRPALSTLNAAVGMIPNLAATMAESPTLIASFVGAFGQFASGTFTGAEKQALLLTNAVTNRAPWAVAFHSTLALKEGVAPEDVRAIREGRLPGDAKLAALSGLTRALIEKRGQVGEVELAAMRSVGFGIDRVLEVIAGLAVSTMANHASQITHPPLEPMFQPQAWDAPR